jgi:hypothetical protein
MNAVNVMKQGYDDNDDDAEQASERQSTGREQRYGKQEDQAGVTCTVFA